MFHEMKKRVSQTLKVSEGAADGGLSLSMQGARPPEDPEGERGQKFRKKR